MSLTGTPLLVLVIVLVGLTPLLVVARWRATVRRGRPNGAGAGVGRLLALVACQLTAMVLTFLVANNSYASTPPGPI